MGADPVGHQANSDREYRLLQKRLDRTITGAPDSPVLNRILRMLYRPEDVERWLEQNRYVGGEE